MDAIGEIINVAQDLKKRRWTLGCQAEVELSPPFGSRTIRIRRIPPLASSSTTRRLAGPLKWPWTCLGILGTLYSFCASDLEL